jgi:HAD superfamily hydrolase (TIGR01509 family)
MKKLIVFDLDGVLIDSKQIHFDALNKALFLIDSKYVITDNEQEKFYEGLPTKQKLKMLNHHKGLPEYCYNEVSENKQVFTKEMLSNINKDDDLISYFKLIKSKGINIAVASNSIRETINICLDKLGVYSYIDHIVSNEDVKFPKPHPEMYWKAMSYFGCISDETVIFEDSIVGRLAATDSKATLIEVKNRKDLSIDKIEKAMHILDNIKGSWKQSGLNVLIPMAGAGSRFAEAGYAFPKPLIEVNKKPMIQAVVENLAIDAKYTYIVQKEHFEKYSLDYLLNAITPNCNIVQVDGITEGAAVTALLAKEFINNDSPLIMANSDQIVEWSSREFIYELHSKNADGGIAVFKSNHPKWSYAKVDDFGLVSEVAEKRPISDNATVGIYYWKHGSDFVKYAEQMIEKNIRVNNEFYVCPVYNEAIGNNKAIYSVPVKNMWGIGTPEDLNEYLRKHDD